MVNFISDLIRDYGLFAIFIPVLIGVIKDFIKFRKSCKESKARYLNLVGNNEIIISKEIKVYSEVRYTNNAKDFLSGIADNKIGTVYSIKRRSGSNRLICWYTPDGENRHTDESWLELVSSNEVGFNF